MILGVNSLPIRFFPVVADKKSSNHGFLSYIGVLVFSSVFVMSLLFYLFYDTIVYKLLMVSKENALLVQNARYLLPMGVLAGLALVATQYAAVFKKIVVPALFNNLMVKIGTIAIIVLVIRRVLLPSQISTGLILIYSLVLLGLLWYVYHLGEMRITRIDFSFFRKLRFEMADYALFSILGGVGYLIAFRIDSIMVSTLVGCGR